MTDSTRVENLGEPIIFDIDREKFGYRYLEDENETSMKHLNALKDIETWFFQLAYDDRQIVLKQWSDLRGSADYGLLKCCIIDPLAQLTDEDSVIPEQPISMSQTGLFMTKQSDISVECLETDTLGTTQFKAMKEIMNG